MKSRKLQASCKRTAGTLISARCQPLCIAIAAALAAGFAPDAGAATKTWDGSAWHNSWQRMKDPDTGTTSSNWKNQAGNSAALQQGDTLVFAGTRRLSNTNNDTGLSLSGISFAAGAGAFTLGGNTVTLSSGAGSAISNNSSSRQTFNLGLNLAGSSLWQGGGAGLTFNGQVNVADANLRLGGGVTINNTGLKVPGTNIFQNFEVGVNGSGTLSIESGAVVGTNMGVLGINSGSNGLVTVTGAGSQWNANANTIYVGYEGSGGVNIQNSGHISADTMRVGDAGGGKGIVNVSGTGSLLNISQLILGGSGSGTGVVSILDSGQVSARQMTIGAKGRLNLDGGTLQIDGGTVAAGGVFDWIKGTLSYTGDASIGAGLLSSTTTVGSGRSLKVGGALSNNNGILRIENGGVVSNTYGSIGSNPADQGSVTVSGLGSQWNNAGELHIGQEGSATLNIENGALVSGNWVAVGGKQGSQGRVNISGAGSQLLSTADVNVGWEGSGVLNISSGAELVNQSTGHIGAKVGSSGTVEVAGAGSRWVNSMDLFVGEYGAGTLNIKNGAVVSNTSGQIGDRPGSHGSATVSGAGSQWNNRFLFIGLSGGGSLNIESGGVVNSVWGSIGRLQSGHGIATVTGVGSRLNVAEFLSLGIGEIGTSELNILDGGSVSAKSLKIARFGLVNLGDGAQLISLNDTNNLGTVSFIGEGAKLISLNGTNNLGTVSFSGNSSIQGQFTNAGHVAASAGTTGTLSFLDAVGGPGSYAGNILFKAAFNPGNDPSAISFNGGNASFDPGSVLTMEFFGGTPSGWYDQLLSINTLTFKGTLNLVFGDGYAPTPGTQFALFDFDAFAGSFAADHITVTGYDKSKLDFSRLAVDGTLSVTAVPEPGSWGLMLAGLLGVGLVVRRRRAAVA